MHWAGDDILVGSNNIDLPTVGPVTEVYKQDVVRSVVNPDYMKAYEVTLPSGRFDDVLERCKKMRKRVARIFKSSNKSKTTE